jgi:hypothetical protein
VNGLTSPPLFHLSRRRPFNVHARSLSFRKLVLRASWRLQNPVRTKIPS